MITVPVYATRDDVKAAPDFKDTARDDARIDRAIESASRSVEGCLHRKFYPQLATRTFDWPNDQYASPWRLWLNQHELISVSTLVSGGVTISSSDYFLRPDDGPPFTYVEIDLDSSSAFSSGDTWQRSIAITGVFGHSADEAAAGALGAAVISTSATTLDVTDSSLIGVGQIIKAGTERMIVSNKAMLDTAVDIDAGDSLTASNSDVSITLSTATNAPNAGEVILIDSERMLVIDRVGTLLTVKRAWDGSVLATHAAAASIHAPRTLTVVRGALGTTATTHLAAAAVTKHVVPALVSQLCIAESLVDLFGQTSAYATTRGSGDNSRPAAGTGLDRLRDDAYTAYGRKARIRAV